MGSVHLHLQMLPSVPYLRNGWTDRAEIWCVVRDPLAMRFTPLRGGVHLRLRTCAPLFRLSGTARRIVLKFGMLLDTN